MDRHMVIQILSFLLMFGGIVFLTTAWVARLPKNPRGRKELAVLKAEVERLVGLIREQQETADTRECPCRLHFKHSLTEEQSK